MKGSAEKHLFYGFFKINDHDQISVYLIVCNEVLTQAQDCKITSILKEKINLKLVKVQSTNNI